MIVFNIFLRSHLVQVGVNAFVLLELVDGYLGLRWRMTEVSHAGHVRLGRRAGQWWLHNGGTGEKVAVEEGLKLQFSQAGCGSLIDVVGASRPISGLLDRALCSGRRPGHGADELFVHSGSGSTWLADILDRVTPEAVSGDDPRGPKFVVQVSLFDVDVGGYRAFWSSTHLAEFVFENANGTNYIGKRRPAFNNLLESSGLKADELRPPRRSVLAARSFGGGRSQDGHLLQFWSGSTRCALAVLAQWAVHPCKLECGHSVELAAAAIDAIVSRALDVDPIVVLLPDGVAMCSIEPDGTVTLDSLRSPGIPSLTFMADRLEARHSGGSVLVRHLLSDLLICSQRLSRFRSMQNGIAQCYLCSLLDALTFQVEVSVDEPWWDATSLLELAPKAATSKSRVMSLAYKQAVLTAAVDTAEPLRPRHLFAAANVLTPAKRKADCLTSPSAKDKASAGKRDYALGYLAEGRGIFSRPPVLHVTVDGVAAGGEENELFINWLPSRNTAGIVLQVTFPTT